MAILVPTVLATLSTIGIVSSFSPLIGLRETMQKSKLVLSLFFRKILENVIDSYLKAFLQFFDPLTDFAGLDRSAIEVVKQTNVKFADVAGNEEAKEELKEIVEFLKDTKKFTKLGAKLPKGVLLSGPPGTGKTLLAKAVAGEAGTPFLKATGSQFVELLVGVGANRVRELFQKAKSLQPAIIFIDEIDSIARARSSSAMMGGGNDEREQTLNQLLTEMDGFKTSTGIIVIAATNRPDILDPAIKRPGRFDRQISLTRPNLSEREAILKVHLKGKKLEPLISSALIAQRTTGFSGADLANVVNEAAILAARRKKNMISMREIDDSIDRFVLGLEDSKELPRLKLRYFAAVHEMAKAFLGTVINEDQAIQKITLVSRRSILGTTWTLPSLSEYNSRNSFITQILLGISGRAAEEVIFGLSETTGRAQQDLTRVTRTLRMMIFRYAMTRLQQFKQEAQQRNLSFLGSDVKFELNNIIDNFLTNFLDLTYQEVICFLEKVRPESERLIDELLQKEQLTGMELLTLAREYLSNSNLVYGELVYTLRNSLVAKLAVADLKKSE